MPRDQKSHLWGNPFPAETWSEGLLTVAGGWSGGGTGQKADGPSRLLLQAPCASALRAWPPSPQLERGLCSSLSFLGSLWGHCPQPCISLCNHCGHWLRPPTQCHAGSSVRLLGTRVALSAQRRGISGAHVPWALAATGSWKETAAVIPKLHKRAPVLTLAMARNSTRQQT